MGFDIVKVSNEEYSFLHRLLKLSVLDCLLHHALVSPGPHFYSGAEGGVCVCVARARQNARATAQYFHWPLSYHCVSIFILPL